MLDKCHQLQNRTEYEGVLNIDARLVDDLIAACRVVAERVVGLPPLGTR